MLPFPMNPRQVAEKIDMPLRFWAGNCHAVAWKVLEHFPVQGARLARGHYHGPVAPGSIFTPGINQHSWISLPDSRVLDPTRWCFDDPAVARIHVGYDLEVYDEGCLALRRTLAESQKAPPPLLKSFRPAQLADVADCLGVDAPRRFHHDAPDVRRLERTLHIALNTDPDALPDARGLYTLLKATGKAAFVQQDAWARVMEPESLSFWNDTRIGLEGAPEEWFDCAAN